MSDNTAPPAPEPFSVARRQVLLGAGVGGVALLAAACGSSSSSSSQPAASAAAATTGAAPSSEAASSTAPPASSAPAAKGLIALSAVPSDTAVSVPVSNSVSQQGTLLMTQSGGKLTALDATCTHMQCKVAPAQGKLACPCHGSQYTLTGQVTQGPAPAPLHTVAVKVVGGQVVLA